MSRHRTTRSGTRDDLPGCGREFSWPAMLALSGCLVACTGHAPLKSVLQEGEPTRVELSDTPFFPQDEHQCGPAALATVLAASGVATTPEELVSEVFMPGRQGSLQLELLGAARRRGRLPYQLSGTPQAILAELQAGRPVLVLQNLGVSAYPIWHYAVVVGYDTQHRPEVILLRSGRHERRLMSWRRFLASWQLAGNWAVTVLEAGKLPAQPARLAYLEACAGLEAAGQLDAAALAYAAAAERWPENPLVQLGLGNVAFAQGRMTAAIAAYDRGLRLSPDDVILRNNLAQALLDSGCTSEALAEAQRAHAAARGSSLDAETRATLESAQRGAAAGAATAGCRMRSGDVVPH